MWMNGIERGLKDSGKWNAMSVLVDFVTMAME